MCMSHLYRVETSIQISFFSIICIAIHLENLTSVLILNLAKTVTKQKHNKHIFYKKKLLSHHYCYSLLPLPTNEIGMFVTILALLQRLTLPKFIDVSNIFDTVYTIFLIQAEFPVKFHKIMHRDDVL